jgi:hypothetical protein
MRKNRFVPRTANWENGEYRLLTKKEVKKLKKEHICRKVPMSWRQTHEKIIT